MINLSIIKLVIWDLDDTFWSGTLSEGPVALIEQHIQLVKELTDRGIVNTVCSKNDKKSADKKLKECGVDQFFVFNSIDWTPKGPRIERLIKDMGLRAANVLFIDDNIVNLNEAKHYSPDISIAEPSVISQLVEEVRILPVTDATHKRLKQYQILEEKHRAREETGDNLAFLYGCNTQVQIYHDCHKQVDRLIELINRTNQLNYTKNRCSKEELMLLLSDRDVNAGYVTVSDKFGDYGIVGFYAIKNGECIHFLFSCRTIGQGVEQYVYATLGWPKLTVVGDVVNYVSHENAPHWINQIHIEKSGSLAKKPNLKVIFKGGCDLMNMSVYLATDKIIEEFTYIGEARKNNIEHHYHTRNLLSYPFLSESEQKELVEKYIFNDKDVFNTHIYDSDVAIIFLGVMIQPNLGVYRHKGTGQEFAFGEYGHPLTEPTEWDNYINNTIFTADNHFTREWLEWFTDNHDFLGPMTAEQSLADYKEIAKRISPNAKLCLLLGSEIPFANEKNPNYFGREKEYEELNDMIKEWAKENPQVLYVEFSKYIHGQEDFTNNINHFQRRVYYEAAKKANEYIAALNGGRGLHQKSHLYLKLKMFGDRIGETGFYQTNFWKIVRGPYVKFKKWYK